MKRTLDSIPRLVRIQFLLLSAVHAAGIWSTFVSAQPIAFTNVRLVDGNGGSPVEHGRTPTEAITIATKNAAKILNADTEWGTLEPGKLANVDCGRQAGSEHQRHEEDCRGCKRRDNFGSQ